MGDKTGERNMRDKGVVRVGGGGKEDRGKEHGRKKSGKGRGGGKRVGGDRTGEGNMGKREWKG